MLRTSIAFTTLLAAGLTHAALPGPLVDADWLAEHSCDDNLVVLDIRNPIGNGGGPENYLEAHVPCAIYSNYATAGWRARVDDVPGMLPSIEELSTLVGNLGIQTDRDVVIYAGGTSALDMGGATRVFWTLKLLGVEHVAILDGGWIGYQRDENRPVESGENTPEAVAFKPDLQLDLLADRAEVVAAIESGEVELIDHRPEDMYRGINKHPAATAPGTLPGALNVPERWMTVKGGGSFRSPAQLRQLFELAGSEPDATQINFCNTGHWASLGWFVSHELLGNPNTAVYDGSMVEWTQQAEAPIQVDIVLE